LRLCRRLHRLAVIAAIAGAMIVSGCSYRLASLVSNDDADSTPTGSIARSGVPAVQNSNGSGPAEADLAYARAAASDVLGRAGKDSSVPWQNPQTGASGNIMPLDTPYSEGGQPCRDFLASYVHGAAQDWLQGAACRTAGGSWQVMRLTPLKPG
jgi:surface antigen